MKRTILYLLLIVILSLLAAACSVLPPPAPTATLESVEKEPEIESGFADVNDTRLYYETAGDGEAVVLIHGFGGNTLSWQKQFAALAESYKVVNYDMRGFGKSDNPTN